MCLNPGIKKARIFYAGWEGIFRVEDGTRTHDPQNHNLML
jgi:hypothetical protein